MHRKPKILVAGSFVMDLIAATERLPGAGQTVYGKSFHTACGGKGANQAVQCARLGADVTIVGCVGDDIFGKELLETVSKSGVDTSHVRMTSQTHSGIGHITLEVCGQVAQNRIVLIPGANPCVSHDDIAWLENCIHEFDMVLLQLEIPVEINRTVARWAKAAGVPVVLNPAPATELDDELLSMVSYLIPNEQEAAVETGLQLRSDDSGINQEDLQKIASALWEKGVENVIITLGSSGSAVVDSTGIAFVPCVKMPFVADPTAAGDSFVGALSTALSIGLTQPQSLSFASHTAALTVSHMGAMPSLPVLEEVIALLRERDSDSFPLSALNVLR